MVEPAKPVAKVREPVADEQLAKLKATLKAAQDAQKTYSKFTQEQVCTSACKSRGASGGGGGGGLVHCLPGSKPHHAAHTSTGCHALWVPPCIDDKPSNNTDTALATHRHVVKHLIFAAPVRACTVQVDHIFRYAAEAANAARIPLAKMAVEETRMGVVEDKVIKNHFASEVRDRTRDHARCWVCGWLACKRVDGWGCCCTAASNRVPRLTRTPPPRPAVHLQQVQVDQDVRHH